MYSWNFGAAGPKLALRRVRVMEKSCKDLLVDKILNTLHHPRPLRQKRGFYFHSFHIFSLGIQLNKFLFAEEIPALLQQFQETIVCLLGGAKESPTEKTDPLWSELAGATFLVNGSKHRAGGVVLKRVNLHGSALSLQFPHPSSPVCFLLPILPGKP